jgi:hypothetical protein
MVALQRLNTAYFLTGYLGFVVTWVRRQRIDPVFNSCER